MTLAWLLLQFIICAALIARAGYVLSQSADVLAQAHGWGRGWVGCFWRPLDLIRQTAFLSIRLPRRPAAAADASCLPYF
jgi:hypothetical protein